jgi:FdhE protein
VTLDAGRWIDAHAYLRPLARFCGQVEAAAQLGPADAPLPTFDDYKNDFLAGTPLLQSTAAAVDLEPAGRAAIALIERLAAGALEGRLAADARRLADGLRSENAVARRVASWLIGDRDLAPAAPGLLRYAGWIATARYLRPILDAFDAWRDDERWLRNYCPACGSPPAMAQLTGVDPGRRRFLVCGGCRTRWRYGRTGCPFCQTDTSRIAILTIEREGGLRIDSCESCQAYLKTYDGQGDEALLLADWTSLHIDVAAQDRGLKRRAASLFEFAANGGPSAATASSP